MQNITKKIIALFFVLGFFTFFGAETNAVGAPFIPSATATNITSTSAQLNGVVNPNGSPTTAWFGTPSGGQYGTQSIGGGTSNVTLTPYTLTGLQPNTTYQFNVRAQNSYGNTVSSWVFFTTSSGTPPPPPPPPQPLPSVDLSASQTNLSYGGSTTIYWDAYNATSCNGSGGSNGWAGPKNPNGGSFNTGALYQTTTYSITCTNSAGSDSDSLTIYVTQAPPPPPQAPSVNLSANSTNLPYNGSTTLTWYANNASSCYATGGTNGWAGQKPLSGTFNTGALTQTVTYTLTCTGAGGSASDSVTINVGSQPVQNPTVNLTASPTNVAYGGSTVLSWNSSNATSCVASGGWSGQKPTNGSQTISNLTNDATFTLTCTGSGGSASDSVFVNVGNQPVQNPVVNLSANPTYVTAGSTTNLSWTSSNATSCTASGGTYGWSGYKPTSGSQVSGPIHATTTFTLTCTNSSGGSASDSVTVYVQQTPVGNSPTVDLNAYPTSVSYGSSSTLSWSTSGATSCVASGSWSGNKNTSGSENTGAIYSTNTFTLTCSNSYGSTSDSVTVTVGTNNNNDDLEVTTKAATEINNNSATLNGELEEGDDADVWFEYSEDRDDLDDDDCTGDCEETNDDEADEGDEFEKTIHGLDSNTTYYFRAVARNNSGTDYGSIRSFRTHGTTSGGGDICTNCAPQAVTTLATNVDNNSARLNGLGIINGNALTTGYFEWGRTNALGNTTPTNVIGSTGSNPYSASLFSLSSNTTYYYRAVVINQHGISRGDITTFRTSGGSVAGSSTVVYRNTTVVSNDVSGTARPSLVMLDIDRDDETIYRGGMEDYTVTYRNISKQHLRNIVLQVSFPKEFHYMDSSRGYLSEVNNAVVVNVGDLAVGEEGMVHITVRVTEDAELGKIVVVAATLAYTKTDDAQEEVFAYTKNTIDEGRIDLRGGAIFGAGFLPNSLLGWILLLLILLLILLAAKRLMERSDRRVHITDTRGGYGGGHVSQTIHPAPPSNLPGAHTHNPVNEPPRYY